jgi:hypothetical protein
MLDSIDKNETFHGSIMVLIPEDIFLAGDDLTNEYVDRMIELFDECTAKSDFIVNNTDDYKFLHAMEDRHPEWFNSTVSESKDRMFKMYEDMGHEVDRSIDTVVFKTKLFWFFKFKKSARLITYDANAKISKKLMLQPSYVALLYYISFILCSVFDSRMIENIAKGEITLAEMFNSPWIRNTYKFQFSKLLAKIESTPTLT